MHLDCVKAIHPKLVIGGLICINDVLNDLDFKYKGRTAVPYLLETGCYQMLKRSNNAILLKKIREENVPRKQITNPRDKYIVTLLCYKTTEPTKHTNWYPWNRFYDVFKTEGYRTEWLGLDELVKSRRESERRIFICWNEPTCLDLLKSGLVHKDDIILQKLTSLGKGHDKVEWGHDANSFYKGWNWPIYRTVEYLYDLGFNIYGFGCRTHSSEFPIKHKIVQQLEKNNRLFWINWGSTVFNKEEVLNCQPIVNEFKYDVGFVGSKWGKVGRGNIDQWNSFVQPIVNKYNNHMLRGSGFHGGQIDDNQAKQILKQSKLCPIIHVPSWVAEKGVQDRFYTVFTAGRFGVVDNPGVYDFFNSDEVVCETNPEKYIEKSIYYLENVKEQVPYIQKIQSKIKGKYNLYYQWDKILGKIIRENSEKTEDHYNFLSLVNQLHTNEKSFIEE